MPTRCQVLIAMLMSTVLGCSDDEVSMEEDASTGEIPQLLSEYGFFEGDGSTQQPASGVVPYDVISELFADYAVKQRFIVLPQGEHIGYSADGKWELPVGTTIIKTFAYPADLRDPTENVRVIETRLIIRGEDGIWTPRVYVWNEEQTDAERSVAGAIVPVTFIDPDGVERQLDYRVPNTNLCHRCHGEGDSLELLGLHTRQMDRENTYDGEVRNQIDYFDSLGMFETSPPAQESRTAFPDPLDDVLDVEPRARAYLDANCSHCHSDTGVASASGLFLNWFITDPGELGVCHIPFAGGAGTGGRYFDIVPGRPDESVMVFRMESEDAEVKMPELPSQLSDALGAQLIREWIAAMTPVGCGN